MRSRIPITLPHLQYATEIGRAQLDSWLDELVLEGTLDMGITPEGEMLYTVPGATRPKTGAKTFAEYKRGKKKNADKAVGDDGIGGAILLANKASKALTQEPKEGEKSVKLSAGLSLLGPIGWLYAGSLKEAVPATAAAVAIAWLLPSFLLTPLLLLGLPASAVIGLLYGWQYNKHGKRMPLVLADPAESEDSD